MSSVLTTPMRRLGDNFRVLTPPRSSPTMMMGSLLLKATCVSLALFTTFCAQMCSLRLTDKSYM